MEVVKVQATEVVQKWGMALSHHFPLHDEG